MGVILIRRCPRCGILFDCYCQSNTRCWCLDLPLGQATLERIQQNYPGCLCPECLKTYEKAADDFKNGLN